MVDYTTMPIEEVLMRKSLFSVFYLALIGIYAAEILAKNDSLERMIA